MARTVRIRLTRADPQNSSISVLLVLERGEHKFINPNFSFPKNPGWGLPGGRVHDGEDIWMAANRELLEECGLTAQIPMDSWPPIEHNASHHIFVFEANDPRGVIAPQDPQIVAAEWVPLSYMMESRPMIPFEGKDYPVYRTHLPWIQGHPLQPS